jgi:abhydrolase domain-containing protein 6
MKNVLKYLLLLVAVVFGLIALFPEETTTLAVSLERSASGMDDKTVVVGDETWHYLEGGPEGAPVLLLLHGFGGDKDNWTRFARSLTDDYRVIAPDLPGFGESEWHPDWNYSLYSQRDRINGFVWALKLGQFHVAGNSMGGHVAALYSHEYPEDVLSLALLNNAGVQVPVESDLRRALAQGENPLIVEAVEDFDFLLSFVAFKQPFVPWPIKGVFAQRAVDHAESNRAIFDAYAGGRSAALEPILADIQQPVLIIWGEYDRVLDVSSVDVIRPLLPRAQVAIMKDTGHIPMIERPAETARLYLGFLENPPRP